MYGLKEDELTTIREILKKYNVKKAILYGSRAMGTYKNGSDIDIVIFGNDLNSTISYIYDELEENLPYFIDIEIFENITNQKLKNHIAQVGKVLYQR